MMKCVASQLLYALWGGGVAWMNAPPTAPPRSVGGAMGVMKCVRSQVLLGDGSPRSVHGWRCPPPSGRAESVRPPPKL